MVICMFKLHNRESGKDYYIYSVDERSGSRKSLPFLSIDELVETFRKELSPNYRGTVLVKWEAPSFLRRALDNAALKARREKKEPTFSYGIIDSEDRCRINGKLPEGVELELE